MVPRFVGSWHGMAADGETSGQKAKCQGAPGILSGAEAAV